MLLGCFGEERQCVLGGQKVVWELPKCGYIVHAFKNKLLAIELANKLRFNLGFYRSGAVIIPDIIDLLSFLWTKMHAIDMPITSSMHTARAAPRDAMTMINSELCGFSDREVTV